ncbi:MAG: FapA family protein [Treponema sp.]|jgi:uncharacterized protein (DUF342 family)|nr:FapA family protein [Treponema sp.]
MAAIAKGTVDIVINSEATAATLVFIPDAEGLGWDCDAVIKLAREKGVNPLPAASDIDLETFMSKAARAKTPMEKIIAESAGPEEAEAEGVLWETLAVPGDMEAFRNETIAKAKGPLLFRTKIEKVKRDTIVRKPGKFPFMAAKEEVVTVWEKKETREPVLVRPDLLGVRYAAANDRLGVFSAAKPGKPGKNIYGKASPPAVLEDPSFYLGEGIRREKNDLYAVYGGFVRIGKNWADIVPLSKPRFEVKTGSDRVTLFLNFYVGDPRFPLPAAADALQAAKNLGAGEGLVSAEDLSAALSAAVKNREDLLAFPLLLPREAEARVAVSGDGLKAELILRKGVAGAPPLEMRAISQAIKDSKVQGYKAEELKAAVNAFMQGSAAALTYTLVEGSAATRGAGREVQLVVKPLDAEPARVILSRLAPGGAAAEGFPASEAEQICIVEKGARIAQVTKPPDGEQGKDVFGRLMPGLPGNDPDLKLFRGLHLHGSDIIADDSGLLLMKGGGKVFWATITEYRDAAVKVNVSGDGMEAACELVCSLGAGLPLTAELVQKVLAEAGVTRGVNKDGVETACKLAALKGKVNQVLARGRRPVAAGGAALSWLIPEPRAGARMAVTKGMALVDVITLAEGRAGFTVRGEDLLPAAEANTAENPSWDESVAAREVEIKASDEDGSAGSGGPVKRLFAAYGGELVFDGTRLSVSSLKSIQGDISPASEKINFSGEVRITGSVHAASTVMGGRDVLIGGSVEAALVSAGGKVVIVQGIKGCGRAVVRAKTTVESSFAEAATLLAVEDIKLVSRCLSCSIKTNGRVLSQGRLSGGVCKARKGIEAAELGDEESTRTEISFGQNYLIQDQIEAAEREIEKTRIALAKTDSLIRDMAANPASLEAARQEKVRLLKMQEQFKLKVFSLREKFEEHFESELRIGGPVHPGVVMESHGRYYEINEKRQGVVFYFNRETGRIMEKPLA